MIVEGNLSAIEECLQKFSSDVRYLGSKNARKNDKGKRMLSEGVFVRGCSFAFQMRSSKAKPLANKNEYPLDNRHTRI
jgi:hypothetical protein